MNLRETILAAQDSKRISVDVPEWGVTVYLRTLSGTERDAFEGGLMAQGTPGIAAPAAPAAAAGTPELFTPEKVGLVLDKSRLQATEADLANLRARLVALCAVDADGKRIFADDDIPALGGKASAPLDRLFSAAQELNGLSGKDVEDLEGN